MARINASSGRLAPRPYQRVNTGNPEADRAQQEAERRFRDLNQCPILSGHLIKVLDFTTAEDRVIEHGLGRNLRGVIQCDCVGGPPLWVRIAGDDKTFTIRNNGTVTLGLALWVY